MSVSISGITFGISDAVMGLTVLAAGNCLPEAISSILMVCKGEKGVGVSNSLGSCSLDILLSLGVPWLIKNLLNLNGSGEMAGVEIKSNGIRYTVFLLFASIVALYLILSVAKYRLQRSVGIVLGVSYLILVTFSILLEIDVFGVQISRI